MTVCDTDKSAIKALGSILDVKQAIVGSVHLNKFHIENKFDLIWVGSLFTHVDDDYAQQLITFLSKHLNDNGVVVFTYHGEYVANRIKTREKMYHLDDERANSIINQYDHSGYGFSEYPNQKDYGISIAKTKNVLELIKSANNLDDIYFKDRGWVNHQDVAAFIKRSEK